MTSLPHVQKGSFLHTAKKGSVRRAFSDPRCELKPPLVDVFARLKKGYDLLVGQKVKMTFSLDFSRSRMLADSHLKFIP